jgi:hypothetical protein
LVGSQALIVRPWENIMIGIEWVTLLGAFLAVGVLGAISLKLDAWEKRRVLRDSLHSLRLQIAQAETWVEAKPTSKEAEENLARAKKLHDTIEDGLKRGTNPWTLLRYLVTEPGFDLAISARFRAQADKRR